MNLHFIAIGGSAMHNLAIAMHKKGYNVTGSDDQIFEPSKSRLAFYNLLPKQLGWDDKRIHLDVGAVILGMHAKADNPELLKAKELGLKIYSYPEFLYEQSKGKTRIVVGGSHGKTTITAMILHVLNYHGINTDYMVGAQLDGFDVMVKITDDAPFIVLEGDEYLSSPIDKRPKFHLYKPHIAIISGIAWDHINVFPTFENYVEQFRMFLDIMEDNGKLIYCSADKELASLCSEPLRPDLCRYPYDLPEYRIENGRTIILHKKNEYPLLIFGRHNLLNLSGAMNLCRHLCISDKMFLEAIRSFKGASNRLQMLAESKDIVVFKDFAHAPSKLMATTLAVREQYPNRKLVAIMELHTYSSLSRDFLIQYNQSMANAENALIFYNPEAIKLKRLPEISVSDIKSAFGSQNIEVYSETNLLQKRIRELKTRDAAFLFMSSANFDNLDLNAMANFLVSE